MTSPAPGRRTPAPQTPLQSCAPPGSAASPPRWAPPASPFQHRKEAQPDDAA